MLKIRIAMNKHFSKLFYSSIKVYLPNYNVWIKAIMLWINKNYTIKKIKNKIRNNSKIKFYVIYFMAVLRRWFFFVLDINSSKNLDYSYKKYYLNDFSFVI